jgi:hypothetical protein
MRGRLNAFQRSMLRFRELHPYNAAHVVEIGAPFGAAALSAAIGDEIERRGIAHIALDRALSRYEYRGGRAHAPLRVVDAGPDADARADLEREIETELNAPFQTAGGALPMRFFALARADTFHLALVYDHFIAGGDAIAALLASIAARYAGRAAASDPPPLYPRTYRSLFARHPLDALRAIVAFPASVLASRRAARPHYRPDENHATEFLLTRLDAPAVRAIASRTKDWGVTRNDVLLAALMLALSPHAQKRFCDPRRRELAVASIVNLRRHFGGDDALSFGQFLSSFRVSHEVPPGIGLETLARAVHAQTDEIRRRRLHLRTILLLAVAGAVWRFLGPSAKHRVFSRGHPVWGAVSLLDVNALWPGDAPSGDYVRGVPTGPLSPLVVAATPSRDAMNLGFTFRTAAYSRDAVEQIAADVVHRLDPLAQ